MKTRCITIYDYDDKPVTVELPEKEIVSIFINVISGDETGWVIFGDNSSIRFDASDCRIHSFYDGSYIVLEPDIEDWVKYKPSGNETCSYARQEAFWQKAHKHEEEDDE